MAPLEIELLPVLTDNYVYLLHDPRGGASGVVDPAVAEPVLGRLRALGRRLDWILVTPHHGDHTGGLAEVKAATGARAVGPRADAARIPGLDVLVGEGDEVAFGSLAARVIETPGHTSGHVSYWLPEAEALFCGDTMFALGCGRLFEGDAPTMWRSLGKLAGLPDATRVYCGHEYTQANAKFALTVEPGNKALQERSKEVDAKRARGEGTVPSTMGEELATNPFLRADKPELLASAGLEGKDPVAAFAEIRRRKDNF